MSILCVTSAIVAHVGAEATACVVYMALCCVRNGPQHADVGAIITLRRVLQPLEPNKLYKGIIIELS